MIEKYGTNTVGKPYFQEIKQEMRRANMEVGEGAGEDDAGARNSEEALQHLETAIDDIMENFVFLK